MPHRPRKTASPRERLTPARTASLRELVEGTSRSYRRIGEELGLSPATISRYVRREGWRRPPDAALPARIGSHRERVTEKLWRLTERHAEALEHEPVALAQRSLQPLARLTQVLRAMDEPARRDTLGVEATPQVREPAPGRSLHELRDELEAHLARIVEEEGLGWDLNGWFEDGAGI